MLVCTIGSQGFADGRRFHRGDVYEVDDEIASTLVEAGYAQVAKADVPTPPVKEPEVVAAPETPEVVAVPEEPTVPEEKEDVDKDSARSSKQKGKKVNKRR